MHPRRTRSPLFPYTTLFRSDVDQPPRHQQIDVASGNRIDATEIQLEIAGIRKLRSRSRRAVGLCRAREQDRKSTRLNSSHMSTSYAVFCLKKKKLIRNAHRP